MDIFEILGALIKIQYECERDRQSACRRLSELIEYIEAVMAQRSPV